MSKVEIKNDWAKAVYILSLNYMSGVSMAKVLTNHEPAFYKWQSRLNEVIKKHPKLKVSKVIVPYKSKLDGKQKSYMVYTCLSPIPYVKNLINKLNNEGFKGKTNSPNQN